MSQSSDTSEPSKQFSCTVCGKRFNNKRSQIRHSSYCRKRARNPPKSRKRSCTPCTKAKCHCDGSFPSCSRCVKRNVTCIYQHSTPHANQLEQQSRAEVLSSDRDMTLVCHSTQDYRETAPTRDFDATDENLFQTETLFDEISSTAIVEEALENYGSTALFPHGLANLVSSAFLDPRYGMDFSNLEACYNLALSPALRAPRAFKPKMVKHRQLSLNRKYVICTLRSYPQMLLPGKGPPPFLHPHCMEQEYDQSESAQTSLIDPLARCSGIVAMWSVKNKDNSSFIWRSIRMEQERLSEECHTYDTRTAVAALQAVSVYFIFRVSEQDEDVTDFDIPLIQTMLNIAIRFKECSTRCFDPSASSALTWELWILIESLQRTIFVTFIVDILFDISAGTISDSNACIKADHLLQMRLPCSKSLWKTKTKSEWEKEYATQTNFQLENNYRHPRFIDLIRHDANANSFGSSLDRWMSEVDDFGMLVINAASLVDEFDFGAGC
ncbi:uncharacterized protein LY89DRAFT_197985 [Mollisia scopiformis]|uniref:Zn(2)-C6 fungal-type domain-containing protein n=1 Tax=Mollisia scopiformis TaxID=149040 RepID=A0A194WZF9_MOLSC|nr:uncharacterized protein LY89DRAFT_197985 [Mollisia scopiformis]KUJ12992.1 hypothetical protein LY89DRAFT_197985 [Mollisia scopiformis]